jgi:hypothetical protein
VKTQTVHINSSFKVEIDKWNHTLLEFKPAEIIERGKNIGKVRKESWAVVGYYKDMHLVIRKLSACIGLTDADYSMMEHCKAVLDKAETLCASVAKAPK